jgi:hypothetical protein
MGNGSNPPTALVSDSDSGKRPIVVVSVSWAVTVCPPVVPAEIVADPATDTVPTETVNCAVVEPAGTVIVDDGTVTVELLLPMLTVRPPRGAGPLMVTVAVLVELLMAVVGLSTSDTTIGGFTVSVFAFDWSPDVAVMMDVLCVATAPPTTGNATVFCPAGIVTDGGLGKIPTNGLLLVSVTASPPAGAASGT